MRKSIPSSCPSAAKMTLSRTTVREGSHQIFFTALQFTVPPLSLSFSCSLLKAERGRSGLHRSIRPQLSHQHMPRCNSCLKGAGRDCSIGGEESPRNLAELVLRTQFGEDHYHRTSFSDRLYCSGHRMDLFIVTRLGVDIKWMSMKGLVMCR